MKKLLGILVLGLLWCNMVYALPALNISMDDDKLVKLLEESTVYTFCN